MTEWYGYLPEGWQISRLKYLVNQTADHAESNTGYIGLENIESWSGKYQKKGDSSFEAEGVSLKVRKGDIIFGKLRPYLAKCYLAEKDACCSTEFIVMTPNKINPVFLKYLLLSPKFIDEINMSTYGSKMPRANWDFIGNTFVPLPIFEEQKIIADYVDNKVEEINNLIEEAKVSIEEYKAWKASIIYEAVTKGLDKDVEMKDSGVEWIGKIPVHWNRIKSGRIIASTQNGITRRDLEKSEGQIVLKLKNISADGNIDYSEPNRIELTENEINSYRLCNDDLLFVRVNGSRQLVGKCAVFHDVGEIVAYNDHIIRTRLSKDYNVRFMQYYLLSPAGKREIELHTSTSAGQFTISGEGLRDLCITYPPVQEQCEIVQYLDMKCGDINCLITEKESLISDLEAYKKSLIFEVVTGKRKVV